MTEKNKSFSDHLRFWFKWLIDPLAKALIRIGITPNVMTILGLLGTALGAYRVAKGDFLWGGIIILLTVPFDALDGPMARLRGDASEWGAFVDSVIDRYSELVVYLGLLIYYLNVGDKLACTLVFLAAAGSVLVSYSRARADSLQLNARVGLLTRVERYLILAPALVFNYVLLALWILAIFANFTALQRILHARRDFYQRKKLQQE